MQTAPENKSHRDRLLDEFLATHASKELETANILAVRKRAEEGLAELTSKDDSARLAAVAADLAAKRDAARAAYDAAELAAVKAADVARLAHEAHLRKTVDLGKIRTASRENLVAAGLTTVRALESRFRLSARA